MIKQSLLIIIAILIGAALNPGCGKARASGSATAIVIPNPTAGVTCYAIMQGEDVRGGNCLKD